MRLLYVAGGHPVQEADDCLMWQKLGIDWFSTGYYAQSKQPGLLPRIDHTNCPRLTRLLKNCRGDINEADQPHTILGQKNRDFTRYSIPNIWKFTPEFLSNFDIIMFNHHVQNIKNNWGTIYRLNPSPPMIIKTFGMHSIADEKAIKEYRQHACGMLFSVRTGNTEANGFSENVYAGYDAVIRGSVLTDEHEVSGWIGDKKEVVTFTNTINYHGVLEQKRRDIYVQCRKLSTYPFRLFGAGNADEILSEGLVSHSQKLQILRNARIALTTGTPNANTTYSFVEAWVMGIPQIVYGPQLWGGACYEPNLLGKHEDDIIIAETPHDIAKYIHKIMIDDDFAQQLSTNSRTKALKIYSRAMLAQQWKVFLDNITNLPYKSCQPKPVVQQTTKQIHTINRKQRS